MNYNRFNRIIQMFILAVTLNACASKGINLIETGAINVSTKSSSDVEIVNVYVRQIKNEVLIHADVRPTERIRFFHPGHLSFELFTSDGEKFLNFDLTRYTREHNSSELSKMKHVSFWLRMPLDIPKGSRLAVTHHSASEHEGSPTPN